MIVEMGYFGFSTWEKILAYMQAALKGTTDIKYVSSFWKNEQLVSNLNREYMALQAGGFKPAKPVKNFGKNKSWDDSTEDMVDLIAQKLLLPENIVRVYFSAIYDLSGNGKIPHQKYDPAGYKQSKKLQEKFDTEKGAISILKDATGQASKILIPIAILASLATGFYIYSKIK